MALINFDSNVRDVQKHLTWIARQQLPFALAQGLNQVAADIVKAEKDEFPKVLDRPTPFTLNAIRFIPATKRTPWATVFIMDRTAKYLLPYEIGGKTRGIGKGIAYLEPGDYGLLNRYGNFPKNALQRLKARKDVFVGTIKTRKGPVTGLWKRLPGAAATRRGPARAASLKLLIKFSDPHPANQHLDFIKRAEQTATKNFNRRLGQALAKAIATAR